MRNSAKPVTPFGWLAPRRERSSRNRFGSKTNVEEWTKTHGAIPFAEENSSLWPAVSRRHPRRIERCPLRSCSAACWSSRARVTERQADSWSPVRVSDNDCFGSYRTRRRTDRRFPTGTADSSVEFPLDATVCSSGEKFESNENAKRATTYTMMNVWPKMNAELRLFKCWRRFSQWFIWTIAPPSFDFKNLICEDEEIRSNRFEWKEKSTYAWNVSVEAKQVEQTFAIPTGRRKTFDVENVRFVFRRGRRRRRGRVAIALRTGRIRHETRLRVHRIVMLTHVRHIVIVHLSRMITGRGVARRRSIVWRGERRAARIVKSIDTPMASEQQNENSTEKEKKEMKRRCCVRRTENESPLIDGPSESRRKSIRNGKKLRRKFYRSDRCVAVVTLIKVVDVRILRKTNRFVVSKKSFEMKTKTFLRSTGTTT